MNKKGYTLTEVIVAMAIVSVTILVLGTILVSSATLQANVQAKKRALQVVENELTLFSISPTNYEAQILVNYEQEEDQNYYLYFDNYFKENSPEVDSSYLKIEYSYSEVIEETFQRNIYRINITVYRAGKILTYADFPNFERVIERRVAL